MPKNINNNTQIVLTPGMGVPTGTTIDTRTEITPIVQSTLVPTAIPAANLQERDILDLDIDWHSDFHDEESHIPQPQVSKEQHDVIAFRRELASGEVSYVDYDLDHLDGVQLLEIMDEIACSILCLRQEISALNPEETISAQKSEDLHEAIIMLERQLKDLEQAKNLPPSQKIQLDKSIWLFKLTLAFLGDGLDHRLDSSKEYHLRKMDTRKHVEELTHQRMGELEKQARENNAHFQNAQEYGKKSIRAKQVAALGSTAAAIGLIPGCNALIVPGSVVSAAGKGVCQYYYYWENKEKEAGQKEIAEGMKSIRMRWDAEIVPELMSQVQLPSAPTAIPSTASTEALLTSSDRPLSNAHGLTITLHGYTLEELRENFESIQHQIDESEDDEGGLSADKKFQLQTNLTRLLALIGQLQLETPNVVDKTALLKLEKQIERCKVHLCHSHHRKHHHHLTKSEEEHSSSRESHDNLVQAKSKIKHSDGNKKVMHTAGKAVLAFGFVTEVGEMIGTGIQVAAAIGNAFEVGGLEGVVGTEIENGSKVTRSAGYSSETASHTVEWEKEQATEKSMEHAIEKHKHSQASSGSSHSANSLSSMDSDTSDTEKEESITTLDQGQSITWHRPDLLPNPAKILEDNLEVIAEKICKLQPENENCTIAIDELQDKIEQMEEHLEVLQYATLSREEERLFERVCDKIKTIRKDLKVLTHKVIDHRMEVLKKEQLAFVEYRKKRDELEKWIRENNKYFKKAKIWENRRVWCRRAAAASAVVGVAGAWNGICAIAGGAAAGITGLGAVGCGYKQHKNMAKAERVLEAELAKHDEEFHKLHPQARPSTPPPSFESPQSVEELFNFPLLKFTPLETHPSQA